MRVNVTLQQLQKIQGLDHRDFQVLRELIRAKGMMTITEHDQPRFATLRSLNLVKGKQDRIWTKFAVNGVQPSPFMGHKVKRTQTDAQKVASIFVRGFTTAYGKEYGTLEALDWTFAARLASQFDLEELEPMLKRYFRETGVTRAGLQDLYRVRNRLLREITQKRQEKVVDGNNNKKIRDTGAGSKAGGGWEAFAASDEGGDTPSPSRRKTKQNR